MTRSQLAELREKFGEAFYLLDGKRFRENFLELKAEFSRIYPSFNIAYSYKTNYTPKLCKIVKDLGGYAEVVSEMELMLAQKIGNSPDRIIWNGPIKNTEVMASFLCSGGTVNVDSIDEMIYIQSLAADHPDTVLQVGLRCNYDVNDGVISRFGFDVESEDFQKALPKSKSEALLNSDYNALIPYYSIANGCFLSDEYEFLSFVRAMEENDEFQEHLSKEELLDAKPDGIVIGRCPDGDVILLCNDGKVVRISHEEPVTVEQWPTLAQFFVDAINE